jgi:hypothetical protein
MSMMREQFTKPNVPASLWFGQFAVDVTDYTERAWVILPDFSPNRIGPCRWQSRDSATLPNRGDECLVQYDNRGLAWVIAWWPFST